MGNEQATEVPTEANSTGPTLPAIVSRRRETRHSTAAVSAEQASDGQSGSGENFERSGDSGSSNIYAQPPPPQRVVRFVEVPGYGESSAEFRQKILHFQRNEFQKAKTLPCFREERQKAPGDKERSRTVIVNSGKQ